MTCVLPLAPLSYCDTRNPPDDGGAKTIRYFDRESLRIIGQSADVAETDYMVENTVTVVIRTRGKKKHKP